LYSASIALHGGTLVMFSRTVDAIWSS
jgi:hypothetical protein